MTLVKFKYALHLNSCYSCLDFISPTSSDESSQHHELTTAVSGFPKSKNGQYSIENILKGQIGDDAYFITRHVDDWNNNSSNEAKKECADRLLNPSNISGTSKLTFFSREVLSPFLNSSFHIFFCKE